MKLSKIFLFIVTISVILSIASVSAINDSNDGLFIEDNAEDVSVDEEIISSDGADETLDSSDSQSAEILEAETNVPVQTIKMGKVTKRYNGGIQYQATFYDADGNPLSNQEVYFEVDDKNDYSAKTDANGVALLTIAIENGDHKIAALSLNPPCVNYDNIKVFNVLTGNKNIKMYYDGGNTYSVRVYGDDGKPVSAGEKVTFYLENKKYTRSTDKNGYAKFKITAKPGYYQIGASYKDYAVLNTVLVKPVLKQLTTFKNKAIKPKIKFKVKFLGKNKKNKKIKVKFNKKTYKAKTNKKGIATFKLKTPKKVGYYKVVVSYKKCKISATYAKYYA